MTTQPLARTLARAAAVLPWLVVLASCGGGVYLGIDIGGPDDRPPNVSLAVSPDAAVRGQPVQLAAAASDDYGVDYVEFYRLDAGGSVLLAVDGQAPFQFTTAVPGNAPGSLQFLARAVDGARQSRDSGVVTVIVLP
jgi:hypothetical protein